MSARVRGIGVAVMISTSALAPLGLQRAALMQPEPVLLVDHREREVGERDRLLHERVGAHHQVDLPSAIPSSDALPLLAGDRAR